MPPRRPPAAVRLDVLETRVAPSTASAPSSSLGDTVARSSSSCAGGQAHDQLAGELTRRLSALDARLARLDPVPGEVQSLRTTMLQEAERTVAALRAADERIGQLAWVPGEFQEARKRIMSLTSGVQAGQDRIRQLEGGHRLPQRAAGQRSGPACRASTPPGPPG